jgi:hypothetical protein
MDLAGWNTDVRQPERQTLLFIFFGSNVQAKTRRNNSITGSDFFKHYDYIRKVKPPQPKKFGRGQARQVSRDKFDLGSTQVA